MAVHAGIICSGDLLLAERYLMEKEDVSETEAFVTFQVFFKVRKQQGSRAQG